MNPNYYEILGVPKDATYSTIRQAYRERVKEEHPDVSDHPKAKEKFRHLKAAYKTLGDRTTRSKYDQLTHNEFVDKYTGYTTEELAKPDAINIKVASQGNPAPNQGEESSENAESDNTLNYDLWGDRAEIVEGLVELIIQGKTSANAGLFPYSIRLLTYTLFLYLSVQVLNQFGDLFQWEWMGIPLIAAGAIICTRLLYLVAFEKVRDKYEKVDDRPEPDAYTIPFTFSLGLFGVSLMILYYLIGFEIGIGVGSLMDLILIIGMTTYVFGYLFTILALGWGTADDYYNLKFNINPIAWNMTSQLSGLLGYLVVTTYDGTMGSIVGYFVAFLGLFGPFIVAGLYLTKNHPEAISELKWRVKNHRITVFNPFNMIP